MTEKYKWTSHYSVGIKKIDEQHKEFIKICNDLEKLSKKKNVSQEELLIKIGQLGSYAFYHLSTEEELFIQTKYPKKRLHIKAHDEFRKMAKMFMDKIRKNKKDSKKIIAQAGEYSAKWLFEHILIMDKKYKTTLKKLK